MSARSLRSAVDRGELKPDTDIPALVAETAAMMDGLQIRWAIDPEAFDMAGHFRTYLDRMLRSVTTNGTGLPDSA